MLECTWNDSEADTAMRRLLLKEKKQEKLLAQNPQRTREIRQSILARLAIERISGTTNYSDSV